MFVLQRPIASKFPTCLSLQLSDTCQMLETMHESHATHLLPRAAGIDTALQDFTQRCVACKVRGRGVGWGLLAHHVFGLQLHGMQGPPASKSECSCLGFIEFVCWRERALEGWGWLGPSQCS